MMTAKAVHSMIRVLDEQRSVAFYTTAFGLDVADRFEFDDFTPHYGTVGGDSADKQLKLGLEGHWEKC